MAAMTMALTEEEEYLLRQYKLLKEKKKALQKLKEKVETKTKPSLKREAPDSTSTPEDARKKAEKLVASGCVKIAKTPVDREFKRARLSEKKHAREPLSDNETTERVSQISALRESYNKSYNSRFVKERNFNETDSGYAYRDYRGPRKGNTIYIKGFGLTEEIVKTAFNKFGTVLETKYETRDRNWSQGFVAFQTCEEAKLAIDEMNGNMVSGVHLKVCYANRQLRPEGGEESEQLWRSRSYRPPKQEQEKSANTRELRKYSDDDFF